MNPRHRKRLAAIVLALVGLLSASCSSQVDSADAVVSESGSDGVRLVSAADAAAIQSDPPGDLIILDVRTLDEFGEGHLDGATMLDFYRSDFADELAKLDPEVPYLLYCRSGNRSGQAAEMMREMGFSDVADVDGGIVAWADLGLPTVDG